MNNNLDKINESNDAVNSFRSTTGMYNDFNVQTEESIAKEAEVEQQKLDQPVAQVEYEEKACPKCGFKVAPGSKMCIHCGKLLSEEESTPVEVSINPEVTMQETSKVMQAPVKLGKTLSTKPIYIVNAVLFVICLIATLAFGMPYIKNIDIPFLKGINTYITLITMGSLVVTFFYGLCMQLLLYKASYPWWGYFIPGYNILLISKLATGKYTTVLYTLIPCVVLYFIQAKFASSILLYFALVGLGFDLLIMIGMLCGLADRFCRSNILMVLFAPIVIPVTALSSKYGSN